jgi:hypothetical protein
MYFKCTDVGEGIRHIKLRDAKRNRSFSLVSTYGEFENTIRNLVVIREASLLFFFFFFEKMPFLGAVKETKINFPLIESRAPEISFVLSVLHPRGAVSKT